MIRAAVGVQREVHMNQRIRVLLVDDDEGFLSMTSRALRKNGYDCDCTRDAVEAIKAVANGGYDVVIADIQMTGNHELEMVGEMRRRFPDLPVILLTGHPSLETAIEALRLAAIDYIRKDEGNVVDLTKRIDTAVKAARTRISFERQMVEIAPVVEKLREFWSHYSASGVPRGVGVSVNPPSAAAARQAERARDSMLEQLSPREREILEAVAAGKRVGAIARAFTISPYTVRNHLKAIFRKLGVHSQVELLAQLHGRLRPHEDGAGPA
jgi:DNA-binding NarL/FixJ family response regulator